MNGLVAGYVLNFLVRQWTRISVVGLPNVRRPRKSGRIFLSEPILNPVNDLWLVQRHARTLSGVAA